VQPLIPSLSRLISVELMVRAVHWSRPPGIDGIAGECVVKGDTKVRCIAAASVLAKVTRDRIMVGERGIVVALIRRRSLLLT
jgi:ribonuclease HII